MDVRLPDGTIIKDVPDGTTKADLVAKLTRNGYDVSGLTSSAPSNEIDPNIPTVEVRAKRPSDQIPGQSPEIDRQLALENAALRAQGPGQDPTLIDKVLGAGESMLTLGTGATTGALGMLAGGLAGAVGNLTGGRFGMKDGVEAGMQQGAESLTYQPRTQMGQEYAGAMGEALHQTLPAIPLTAEMAALGRGASMAAQGARDIVPIKMATVSRFADEANAPINAADAALRAAPKSRLGDLIRSPKSTLPGVGAAEAGKAAVRADRFERLGVKPTLGQLTRDKQIMKFEREMAKKEEGRALDEHFTEQNQQVQRKFEEFADETGAQTTELRDVGRSVMDAVTPKKDFQLQNIREAYQVARDAGEMAAPVDVTNLSNFVKVNKGKDKLAPIVSMIESELAQNAREVGGGLDKLTLTPTPKRTIMTLDASEDLRQAINALSEPGTPNAVMGPRAIRLIDKATEGKGGEAFQQARRMYENHMNEFGNRSVIAKLFNTKPGTKDRSIALEDVFKHLILDPKGKDDISHVFRVLEAHPRGTPENIVQAGQQAANELRGALVNHIRDKMFSNGGADSLGNTVGSQKKIADIITDLDRKGKLVPIFGRDGANRMRDMRDAAIDIYTTPEGVINTSNNVGAFETAMSGLEKVTRPIPVVKHIASSAADLARARAINKRIQKSLNPAQSVKSRTDEPKGK